MKRRQLVCRECGGIHVTISGFVRWDTNTSQYVVDGLECDDWSLENNFAYCLDCQEGNQGIAEFKELETY